MVQQSKRRAPLCFIYQHTEPARFGSTGQLSHAYLALSFHSILHSRTFPLLKLIIVLCRQLFQELLYTILCILIRFCRWLI